MTLKNQIKQDQIKAQKSRDKISLETLRLLLSEIYNQEIDKQAELSDKEVRKVICQQVKRRQEAIEFYKRGGRKELEEKEEKEMAVLRRYLPAQMDEEEVRKVVERVVREMGGKERLGFGQVMGRAMRELEDKAGGKMVAEMVREMLA